MFEHIADFTVWPILTGILVGYVANRIMSGEGKGCCMNLIIGIIGCYAGTFISHLLNIELLGKGYLTNFVFCVVGAVTVLWLWKKLFKLIIIDSTIAYVGSANLTGAGMGMKSPKKRNFEAGILTDDPEMLEAAIEQFDNVWIGKFFASSSINAVRIVADVNIVQTQ